MSNRHRTSSEISLEIIDILQITKGLIQTKAKPIVIKRRIREQDGKQNIAKSPNPIDYENKDGIFIYRKKNDKKAWSS